ncbi:fibroblast growth factor receptor homolog 1 isoform X5 [Hydra vulgaris]|uniref:Fibroblast growth factor receptor homolog 1 isoform X5 n=1 Tax=Hydra vulgaris TaxID=6087 RepID=A0ABM4CSV7_HYDVU
MLVFKNDTYWISLDFQNTSIQFYYLLSPLIDLQSKWMTTSTFQIHTDNDKTLLCPNCFGFAQQKYLQIPLNREAMSYTIYNSSSKVIDNLIYTKSFNEQKLPYAYFGLLLNTSAILNMNLTTLNVTLFNISYIYCSATVYGLAYYDISQATNSNLDYFITNGSCLSNSEPSPTNSTLQRYCDLGGKSIFFGECFCSAGYQLKNGNCMGEKISSVPIATIAGSLSGILFFVLAVGFCLHQEKRRKIEIVVEQKIIDEQAMKEKHIKEMLENTKNAYLPIDAAIIQSWTTFGEEEPLYLEIPNSYNYHYSDLIIKEKIGEGHFAIIHKAIAVNICGHKGNSTVAVKELKNNCSTAEKEDFENELEIMQELSSHPYIVKLLGICTAPHCIILEYVPGGDLQSCLLKSRKYRNATEMIEGSYLTSYYLLLFAYQIASGMIYLSEKKIVHRDLACRNILVGYGRVCKVADLGLARRLDEKGFCRREKQILLPIKWLSPESIKHGLFSIKSDVWSFGILLWEVITIGAIPYPEFRSEDIPKLLLENKYRMPKPEHCRQEVYDIMLSCWQEDENCRPTFSELAESFNAMKDDKIYVNIDQYDENAYASFGEDDNTTMNADLMFNDQNCVVENSTKFSEI